MGKLRKGRDGKMGFEVALCWASMLALPGYSKQMIFIPEIVEILYIQGSAYLLLLFIFI